MKLHNVRRSLEKAIRSKKRLQHDLRFYPHQKDMGAFFQAARNQLELLKFDIMVLENIEMSILKNQNKPLIPAYPHKGFKNFTNA